VPKALVSDVIKAIGKRLGGATLGDPAVEGVRMGPLASRGQVAEVTKSVEGLRKAAELAWGSLADFNVTGADKDKGAFFPPLLLHCDKPLAASAVHDIEAFGPVNTVMGYDSVDDAIELTKRGRGSLCGSLFTASDDTARQVILGAAAWHGRIMVVNRHSAKESTGHGSPLPHLVHGGPGRAGGGEEMGGMRAVMHYMQRTAIQGSPTTLSVISGEWMTGADRPESAVHPFRKMFDHLAIGETLTTHRRTVTDADIVNFAGISGDFFYAHMDELAARESEIFQGRVAHGYFVLSAAAGLFVHPAPGPVLANYGLENLRFTRPVKPGDTIQARLTVKKKIAKEPREDEEPNGVVEWHVDVTNQDDELVATYDILTLVRRRLDGEETEA
jgi:oxepin-CoA hydrolase/3-oxo-5,6-dehydrosuberyl-CoA semialdehyde dehydrogenase